METQSDIHIHQKRNGLRYLSGARAWIREAVEGEAILKDISITGCRIEYDKHVDIKLHSMYIVRIMPETHAIETFDLLVESRWFRVKGNSCEIGFKIISSPVLFSQYKGWCVKSK